MVACPSCGKNNDPDAKFCNFCGKELKIAQGPRKCPKCGSPNPIHVVFCGVCGADLLPPTEEEIAADKAAVVQTPVPSEPEPPKEVPRCQWCKKPITAYSRVCKYCHRDLITGVFTEPSSASSIPSVYSDTSETYSSSDLYERDKSAGATVAGVLLVLAALAAMGQGVLYLIAQDVLSGAGVGGVSIGCCGGLDILFGIGTLFGGIFAMQRQHFVLSIIGSLCAIFSLALLFVGPLIGVVSLLLIALSKEEFIE